MTAPEPKKNARSPKFDRQSCFLAAIAISSLMLWGCAQASTDDAWDTFRADVASRCERAAADQLDDIEISVDPFGSAHYGLALLSGTEHGTDVSRSLICVYDKQEKTVELGTPFDPSAAKPAAAMTAQ